LPDHVEGELEAASFAGKPTRSTRPSHT
jgi:hypothetical protein